MNDAAPSRPLRGAVIGYGFISERGHVPAYASFPRGRAPLRITAAGTDGLSSRLFELAVARGWKLKELRPERRSETVRLGAHPR